MKNLIFAMLFLVSHSIANDLSQVPKQLFGITLGKTYTAEEHTFNQKNSLPIKKFAGLKRFLGRGIHLYFQPLNEYQAFKYSEQRKNKNDKYFETSFSLYLLPVIPKSISSLNQLKIDDKNILWEVARINWETYETQETNETVKNAYYWAKDLCKTFEVDLDLKPEILDFEDDKVYTCTFITSNRELKIESLSSLKIFSLAYSEDIFNKKSDAIEKTIRKLQANDIRPY